MWHTIAKQISENLNIDFVITHKEQLNQGAQTLAFKISDGQHHFFVKLNELNGLDQFEAESFNLTELTLHSTFFVPDCICTGITLDHSFIVLEWLTLSNQSTDNWQQLGEGLAQMHQKHEQAMFGWQQDNFLGKSIQTNRWHKRWDIFFAEQRIGWQLQLLHEKGLHFCDINEFIEITKHTLHNHVIEPSLLHGHLWRGNVGFVNHQAAVFDAACYYGDREVDLAMSELFGHFPADFYHAYQAHYPLSATASERKPFYQLYYLLNQANVFQGMYLTQAKSLIKQLIERN
ncbi:fructosamine kinase family protein [Pseudoalteromonas tunicata]|uniref:fructosamine kinase family protein n=1 Tax=Pseudoalteromonas tunicata TaxID=314281 RepID=UPI00273FFF23|nr:fructosamine kinase family protein [Pseudoalteromonas tunicata]MDP4982883.1 fructosamine kinase family protein [Pseudoalteromonas tunicata]MDP5211985.1 fructosamine kinase family protein [Pseudoalteromonas tunicata]